MDDLDSAATDSQGTQMAPLPAPAQIRHDTRILYRVMTQAQEQVKLAADGVFKLENRGPFLFDLYAMKLTNETGPRIQRYSKLDRVLELPFDAGQLVDFVADKRTYWSTSVEQANRNWALLCEFVEREHKKHPSIAIHNMGGTFGRFRYLGDQRVKMQVYNSTEPDDVLSLHHPFVTLL